MTTDDRLVGGFGFPAGCVGVVAASAVAEAAGATAHPWYSLAALGVVVLVIASRTTVPAAAGTAAVAWGVHSGFVLGRTGELTFGAGAGLAALVFGGLLGVGLVGGAVLRLESREWQEGLEPYLPLTRITARHRIAGPGR